MATGFSCRSCKALCIFIIQNLIFAWNLFGAGGHSQGLVYSIIPYTIAQFLLAKGILQRYLKQKQDNR